MDGILSPASLGEAIRHHSAGQLTEAETIYRQILKDEPENSEILHRLGVLALQTGYLDAAENLIREALSITPEFTDAYSNLGIVLKKQGRLDEAAESYKSALKLDQDMPETYSNLGNILKELGQFEDAVSVYIKALELWPDFSDAHSNLGTAYSELGRSREAIAAFRHSLELQPDVPEVLANLGAALLDAGEVILASEVLSKAISLDPNLIAAHCNLGAAFREINQTDQAIIAFQRALEVSPDSVMALSMLAGLYEKLNKTDLARKLAQKVLETESDHHTANLVLAICERREKEFESARNRLEAMDLSRANSKIQAMVTRELANNYDRLGEYNKAFELFKLSNVGQAKEWQAKDIDSVSYLAELDDLSARFNAEWLNSWTPGAPAISHGRHSMPVFLLGFPRSGTTLMDQILNAHSEIETLEERPLLESVTNAMGDHLEGYPDGLANLSNSDIGKLRDIYYDSLDQYSDAEIGKKMFVDKLPLNTARVGLIHRIFPGAKIILALRHPCDCCLSGFMQSFQPNAAMASFLELESAAELYAKIMDLWRQYTQLLPVEYIQVRYEDMVADYEGEARRILEFLELSWTDDILSYRQKMQGRRISTPSYHQVAEPIYQRSAYRWRNYEKHFEKVLPILEPYIHHFGYDAN